MKLVRFIARWVFVAAIPLFCLSLVIDQEFTTAWLYTRGFEKYNVEASTGLSKEELAVVAEKFVAYFNSGEERIEMTLGSGTASLFTDEEVTHFQDVKGLLILDRRIMMGSLVVLVLGLIYRSWRRDWLALGKALLTGGILTAAFLTLFVLGAGLNFSWLFLQFHKISFSNNFWSSSGYMIALFPYGFWYDMALLTIYFTGVGAAVAGVSGYLLMRLAGWLNT